MTRSPNSSIYTRFDKYLEDREKVPLLSGFDDFLSRIPHLTYQRLTDCDNRDRTPIGTLFSKDGAGKMSHELNERVKFFNFHFYWGSGGRSIITRMEIPSPSTNLHFEIEDSLRILLPEFYAECAEWSKFREGELMHLEAPFIGVKSSLVDKKDNVKGRVAPYWRSYWYSSMKALVAAVYNFKDKCRMS
ncbi:MAG: hypothetical protein QXS38_01375 [Candidatus Pacearchaeota archaeon]